jgi:hypothetical protein
MSFINQKSKLDDIINKYPFTIQYGMKRTTSADGEYDTPEYFKTFSDAYYYLVNKVKNIFGDIELDKKYEDYGYVSGHISNKVTGHYYLLSLKKAQELNSDSEYQYIYKTPDNGIIYYATISKSIINNVFNNDAILIKNRLQLNYFGLYKTSKSILINDISHNIECINHMYPGTAKIGVFSKKWIDYQNNMKSHSLYSIINNYLVVYDIPLIHNVDEFIDKLLKFQIKYLGFADFIHTDDIIFQELIITPGVNFNVM